MQLFRTSTKLFSMGVSRWPYYMKEFRQFSKIPTVDLVKSTNAESNDSNDAFYLGTVAEGYDTDEGFSLAA